MLTPPPLKTPKSVPDLSIPSSEAYRALPFGKTPEQILKLSTEKIAALQSGSHVRVKQGEVETTYKVDKFGSEVWAISKLYENQPTYTETYVFEAGIATQIQILIPKEGMFVVKAQDDGPNPDLLVGFGDAIFRYFPKLKMHTAEHAPGSWYRIEDKDRDGDADVLTWDAFIGEKVKTRTKQTTALYNNQLMLVPPKNQQ